MEWLNEWIKQIILLVLIATFIDLLLPNSSFDRYVKLVLSLLIIMAILSPILQLINQDLDLALSKWWKTEPVAPTYSMQTIREKSQKLQAFQTKQIEEQWKETMQELIAEELTKQLKLQDVKVKVMAKLQEGKEAQIQSVEVRARSGAPKTDQANHSSLIQPVEQVQIEVGEQKQKMSSDQSLQEKIKQWIAKHWNIKLEQIQVHVETKG